ncbi:MAG: hypothetical protein MN733_10730 [Nitrososphaera sp.]|nr:hypothetical protein [Nitrososphaera sp.]
MALKEGQPLDSELYDQEGPSGQVGVLDSLIALGVASGTFLFLIKLIEPMEDEVNSGTQLLLIRAAIAIGASIGGGSAGYLSNRLRQHLLEHHDSTNE